MINEQTEPVAWALLLYELADAQEGLQSLLREISEEKDFDETDFRIHMAHIYAHLNRAWNGRNATQAQHDDEALWEKWASFPTDLKPPSLF